MRFILFFVLFLPILPQSKMRIIKNKIKKKVDHFDQIRLQRNNTANLDSIKHISRNSGVYTEAQFQHDYLFDNDDEIPWNAVINVFDGRFIDIPEFDIVEEIQENRQLYKSFPYGEKSFINSFSGSPYMSRFRYSFGHNSTDSINLSDFDLLLAYETISLNIKYQQLSFSSDDESIDYSFTSISPGLLLALADELSYLQIFAGLGYFHIDANHIDDAKDIDRVFSGLNMGADLKYFLPGNISLNTRIDYMLVKHNNDDADYFMNFFLSDFNLSYHFNRYEGSFGLKLQQFNNIDLDNPDRSYTLRELYFSLGVYL